MDLKKILSEKEEKIRQLEERIEELEDENEKLEKEVTANYVYFTLMSDGLSEELETFYSSAEEEEKNDFADKYPDVAKLFS